MAQINYVSIIMDSRSQNEAFARIAAAAFVSQLDPSVSIITEIKTAVSEAVTNAVIHGYLDTDGKIELNMKIDDNKDNDFYELTIEVKDTGIGIEDVETAWQPLYTSKPELERSGMGFTMMEAFMDEVRVKSKVGEGTQVIMKKQIARN